MKRAGVKLGERDREALVALGNRLDEQLATVERHAHTLRHIFRRYRTWLNEGAAEALASERHLTAAQREDIRRVLKVEDTDFDFAGRAVAVNDLLTQQVPVEHEEIRKKIPPLRENGLVVTDISHSTVCAALEDTTDCGIALGYFGLGEGVATAGLVGYLAADC